MLDSGSKIVTRVLVVCATLFFLPIAEIAAQANVTAPPVVPDMREVVDGYGRTVHVPFNPTRIISLAPSVTETLYALGVEDRLVGDTDYCDYPPEAQKKKKVGGVINPNLEEIAALHPDLVLLAKEGNMLETVRALDSLGISTYATDAHNVEQIISSTQKLADVLNASAAGKRLTENLQYRLEVLQKKISNAVPLRVLFIVWPEPLMSVGQNTFIVDAIRRAGAVSIVDSSQDWPQISLEEVARLQPDFLIFAASHTASPGSDFEALAIRPGWQILDAVRNRRYAVVSDAIIRPAPRIVSVIEDLARRLHPELFLDKPETQKETPSSNMQPDSASSEPVTSRAMITSCSLESLCAR